MNKLMIKLFFNTEVVKDANNSQLDEEEQYIEFTEKITTYNSDKSLNIKTDKGNILEKPELS